MTFSDSYPVALRFLPSGGLLSVIRDGARFMFQALFWIGIPLLLTPHLLFLWHRRFIRRFFARHNFRLTSFSRSNVVVNRASAFSYRSNPYWYEGTIQSSSGVTFDCQMTLRGALPGSLRPKLDYVVAPGCLEAQAQEGGSFRSFGAKLFELRALPRLALDLSRLPVTDDDLRHIESWDNITSLDLQYSLVTDEGVECLKSLANLKFLDLNETKTSTAGRSGLRKSLPDCEMEIFDHFTRPRQPEIPQEKR